jgi:hypothetical protein
MSEAVWWRRRALGAELALTCLVRELGTMRELLERWVNDDPNDSDALPDETRRVLYPEKYRDPKPADP